MDEQNIDPNRQAQAKRYARINRRLMLIDLLFGMGYIIAWLIFGWSLALKDTLSTFLSREWMLVAGFALVFGGLYVLINIPLSFYSGFILPHRFELSNQTLIGWITDQIKGILIGGVVAFIVLQVIYLVLRLYPDTWWLWAAGFLLLFSIVLANLAPVLLMPLFYKFKPIDEEYADLAERLVRLTQRAGANVKGVYQFDMSRRTKAANAALAGVGNTRRILLGDTLLKEFTEDEIETIMAHELGHHVHHDIPMGIAVEAVTTLVGLYLASLALNWGVGYFNFEGVWDIAALPLLMLVMGAYGLVTMPIGNAFSRWRERQADTYALEATGKGHAYASALTRLANQNLADADPEPWVEFFLYSHPALKKRIARAETGDRNRIQ
jgi:STE24 endopeptidase